MNARSATAAPPRRSLRARLRARWKRSYLNAFYLDHRLLVEALATQSAHVRGTLLDVGCGDRPHASLFPQVTRYLGIEHLAAVVNVEEAHRTSFARLQGVVDVFGDGAALPFADACVDAVLCLEVLEHVPDPQAVARELCRVLRPGGVAVVSVPLVYELHQVPYDFRRYTVFGIRAELERAGLAIEEVVARGTSPLTAGLLLSHAIYRLGARRSLRDGSLSLHPLALPFVSLACAAVQLGARCLGHFSSDEGLTAGYVVRARRADGAPRPPAAERA